MQRRNPTSHASVRKIITRWFFLHIYSRLKTFDSLMMCSIDSIILHPVQYEYSLVVNLGFLESIEKYQLERGRREGDKEMGSLKIIIELLLKKTQFDKLYLQHFRHRKYCHIHFIHLFYCLIFKTMHH